MVGQGGFRGTCSSYLALLRVGDRIIAGVRRPNTPFKLPEDPARPIVMIAAGTGIAPFRGFVQDRAHRMARGETLGRALLFFGCDHPEVDLLYRDELRAWEATGAVTLLPAFFRAPDGDVTFVQHRLWSERARVAAAIDENAKIFVCGDGARMAPAVRDTLVRIQEERTQCGAADADAWLRARESAGDFVADVFG